MQKSRDKIHKKLKDVRDNIANAGQHQKTHWFCTLRTVGPNRDAEKCHLKEVLLLASEAPL